MTPEQINDLRQRVLRGETVSVEELNAGIDAIRGTRTAADTAATEKKPSKSPAIKVDLGAIFSKT